ncbi:hypothetical protein MAPG_09179 [Magnaporthiopsis poae ATCC 64411]|uniref:Uncharacterized protein n=1 Tax=Magnaporthiopsis poae (strain ATCC 64411 / 73-15) TaxID=644358 RepID=A0A0C4E9A0_MAGP6|nr:hypothetical protein MAPG_09179 [Magnaporthiopsis poae ATCC 64411]
MSVTLIAAFAAPATWGPLSFRGQRGDHLDRKQAPVTGEDQHSIVIEETINGRAVLYVMFDFDGLAHLGHDLRTWSARCYTESPPTGGVGTRPGGPVVNYNGNAREWDIAMAYSERGNKVGTVSAPARWDQETDVESGIATQFRPGEFLD